MKVNKFCAHIKTRNLLVCCVLSVDFKSIAAIFFRLIYFYYTMAPATDTFRCDDGTDVIKR